MKSFINSPSKSLRCILNVLFICTLAACGGGNDSSTSTASTSSTPSSSTFSTASPTILAADFLSTNINNLKLLLQSTTQPLTTCDSSNTTNDSKFALCAGSTCTQTGGTISVKNVRGAIISYPEMKCTCPVVTGSAYADLNGGNMQGSCAVPSALPKYPYPIWSLFPATSMNYPQQSAAPAYSSTSVVPQICPGTGNQTVTNCWSFECTIDQTPTNTQGVTTATCYCPLGENLSGDIVPGGSPFYTQAGGAAKTDASKAEACNYNPVGMPIALPSPVTTSSSTSSK
jgi:hypothetical protein